jgi:hypothetical protein
MIDTLHILQERPQFRAVVHVAAREEHLVIKALRVASGKVVNYAHFMSGCGEPV